MNTRIEAVRVEFHLNEGYTKLLMLRYKDNGFVENPYLDIPTNDIPKHLRNIGSQFKIKINEDWSIEIEK